MIPQPIRQANRSRQRQIERTAPLLGLDLASPITQLKNGHAIHLDDWVCREAGITTRGGYTVAGTAPAPIVSLMRYPGAIFGATDTQIYRGSVLAHSGATSGDWQSDVIANTGGAHLLAVNGADTARHYNGTTWAVSAITGADSAKLFALTEHQRRFFMAEKNRLGIWYLGLNAFCGPASIIPMDGHFKKGSEIVAIGSDNQMLMVATKEELAIYQGTNPDDAQKWGLVGVWNIPEPVGKHCFENGAILTKKGLLPVGAIMEARDSAKSISSISRKVDAGIVGADRVIDSLSNDLMIIHDGARQWVMGDTGGWSRFTGFDTATCWLEHDDGLYFGTSDGHICKYGGNDDAGRPIRSFAVDAPSRFGNSNRKRFTRVRPQYTAAHPYVPRIEMLTDFQNVPDGFDAANTDAAYWMWPRVTWPRQPMQWMREQSARLQEWRSISGYGVSGALMLSVQTLTPIVWTGHDLAMEKGSAH